MKNSVAFIGPLDYSSKHTLKKLFFIPFCDLCFRIYASFIPPLSQKFEKIYVDLLGPLIAFAIYIFILQYGHYNKNETISFPPVKYCLGYLTMMPVVCKVLLTISQSNISFCEVLSLLGYALYGHILTLGLSLILFDESSNKFFFLCLIIFSGLSTLRLTIILLRTIPKPGARLLVCSSVCIMQILSLTFVHFAYMHKTYMYGKHQWKH